MNPPHLILIALYACALVVLTVTTHAVGLAVLLRVLLRSHSLTATGFRSVIGVVISLTLWLILIHAVEIAEWGIFYFSQNCLPDAETAFYFSGVTYTTVGYGDIVLPKPWRMLAPIEALTGILMCGLSTGLYFTIFLRFVGNRVKAFHLSEPHGQV